MKSRDHGEMSDATMIVPIGNFTPDLSRRVRETAARSAERCEVVISMKSAKRFSWSALHDLAETLHAAVTPYPIRLSHALPQTRALLRELGIEGAWFVSGDRHMKTRIVIV